MRGLFASAWYRETPLALAALLTAGALAVVAVTAAQAQSKDRACKSNLQQLATLLQSYVARYGSGSTYPTSAPPQGSGPGVSRGPNGAFFSHLWQIPKGAPLENGANTEAVVQRPGQDALFQCPVHGGNRGALTLDYAGPELSNGKAFPGGKLSDRVAPERYIAGDLLLPGDENHAALNFQALRFDGSVQEIVPQSPPAGEHLSYLETTNAAKKGVRTP